MSLSASELPSRHALIINDFVYNAEERHAESFDNDKGEGKKNKEGNSCLWFFFFIIITVSPANPNQNQILARNAAAQNQASSAATTPRTRRESLQRRIEPRLARRGRGR